MKALEFSVETKQLITVGDIYVDVDIRFVDKMHNPNRSIGEQMVVAKLNSELGMLGHNIKQMVKEELEKALKQ